MLNGKCKPGLAGVRKPHGGVSCTRGCGVDGCGRDEVVGQRWWWMGVGECGWVGRAAVSANGRKKDGWWHAREMDVIEH